MISVTIWRKTLVRHGACVDGLALFDSIASMQPESDPRRLRRIRIPRWGALHWIMLVQAGYGEWLAQWEIVPRANLRGADLGGANLTGADLRGADLYGVHLRGADLIDANLRDANLIRADFRGANLRGADLGGTDLTGADLRDANLIRANLRGADLYGTNLIGANLCGAYRGLGQPPIPGWRTDADGYLEREGVTRG